MLSEILYRHPALVCVLSFALCYMMMPIVYKMAKAKNFTVRPNKRSSHTGDIPNIGGMAIVISSLFIFILVNFKLMREFQFVLLGTLIIFFIGFIDDILVLSPYEKILGESLSGFVLICVADIRITNLYGILGIYELPLPISYIISLFVFLAIINSINLIDGIDGLASSHGMLYCTFFGIYFTKIYDIAWAVIAITLIGSLVVYFIYNVFGKNKIFMGDSGSLFLGFVLSALTFHFLEVNQSCYVPLKYSFHNAPLMCLCLMIFPLYDMVRVAFFRIHNHISPFIPDRNHLHHLLLKNNFTHFQTTSILFTISLLFIIIGILLDKIPMLFAFCIVSIIYFCITNLVVRITKPK